MSGEPKFEKRYQTVDFNWGTKGPGGGIAATNFAVRCTRDRTFDAGKYRFLTRVDDGVRVWVDGGLIIDKWYDTPATTHSIDKEIAAGNHQIQIDYYQNLASAQLKFWTERLSPPSPVTVWKSDFHNNPRLDGVPVVTRQFNAVNFDWGTKAPVQGITADYFSARFTTTYYFAAGRYRFTAVADDGIRVYLDGTEKIIDEWHLSSPATYVVEVDVSEGNHQVKVEYFENNGTAVCKLSWAKK